MTKALWNGTVLAESDKTIVVEGNHYFPPDSVNWQYLQTSERTSTCPWKGLASTYSIVGDGKANADAAWVYFEPKPAAAQIAGYVAFWRGVKVEGANQEKPSPLKRLLGRS